MNTEPISTNGERRPPSRRERDRWVEPPPTTANLALAAFALGSVAAAAAQAAGFEPGPGWRWTELLAPVLGCVAAMAALAFRLPLQNVATLSAILWLFSAALLACATASALPFGQRTYSGEIGLLILGKVPLAAAFQWVAIVLASRETARLALMPWRRSRRYGYWVIAAAAVLAAVTDLSWEPIASQARGLWKWQEAAAGAGWYSAPWSNWIGWVISVAVMLAFTTPWMIVKRPGLPSLRPHAPAVWALINLQFIVVNAARGFWLAAAVGLGLTAGVLALAWRGWASEKARMNAALAARPAPQA